MAQKTIFDILYTTTTPSYFKRAEVESVKDFLLKYYKVDKLNQFQRDYPDIDAIEFKTKSLENELDKYGYCMISKHESVTADYIIYYQN